MSKKKKHVRKPQVLELNALVDEAIRLAALEEPRRGYLGASYVADKCERAIWYSFRWYLHDRFTGRIYKRFETGHLYEPRVIEWLRTAGFEIHCENPKARNSKKQYGFELYGGFLSGHLDGFIRAPYELWLKVEGVDKEMAKGLADKFHLLEIKAMVSAKYTRSKTDGQPSGNKKIGLLEGRWWKMKRRGVRLENQMYHGQLHAYMGGSREQHSEKKKFWQHWGLSGPLDKAVFICVNTDTEQLYAEVVDYSPTWASRIKSRALRIARTLEAPERFSENPTVFECEYCEFAAICHVEDTPDKNCRTCKHSVVKLPGDHKFYGKRAVWLCTLHGSGVGNYEPCGDWERVKSSIDDENPF